MKRQNIFFLLLLFVLQFSLSASAAVDKQQREIQKAEKILKAMPDTALSKFFPPNILMDFTYKKLAKEGWTTKEIFAITDDYVRKNRKDVRGTYGYGTYAKEWRPYWYGLVPNDTIQRRVDESISEAMQIKIRRAFRNDADEYIPRTFYTVDDRLNGVRQKGLFRHNALFPASGRIHWIQTHPTDKNKLMIIPDGDGIWRTDNGGKNWIPVTDRIPNRFHRSEARGYAIPVDPDDWNHFFAFMNHTTQVYETFDGGETWQVVPGASQVSSTGFKRGYAFKDAQGTLKMIGVVRNTYTGVGGTMHISEDKGVTWKRIDIPAEIQDVNDAGIRRVWLQEFGFDPENRDIIYFTSARGIYRSTNGLRFENNKFHFERMNFKVYNQNKTTLLYEGNTFPLPYDDGPMMIEIDPFDANKMWVAMGRRAGGNESALFYSEDKGETWVTLLNNDAKIGNGPVFGNETPAGWLGGFGVNFVEPQYMYGCSMSSAKSSTGGKSFNEFAWGIVMKGPHPDGSLHNVSSARHNADNHTIASTPSGRIFRASDAGILMIDKDINGREWTNISGDMGQQLFYAVRNNEFGDQTIIGNTQDVDAQTYRYGRWGGWRGYEGSTVAINPMSNETYFSHFAGDGGQLEGTSFGDSWQSAFSKADPVTGNWYLWRESRMITGGGTSNIGIVRDIGRSVQAIIANTADRTMTNRDFAVARDLSVGSSFFVLRNDGNIVRFDNDNPNYTQIQRPGLSGYNGTCIAVNPDNIFEIYVGDTNNGIIKTTNGGNTWASISKGSNGIPSGVSFNKIYYHEGSGDIYAVSNSSGIFLLENGSNKWRLWMKGYNPAAFTGAEINYTTQEMMIYDYGRGVWIADLENPSDRFFKNGFKLKELSNTNGVRTFGIDTTWDLPLYYNYKWTVNGVERTESPYRYFSASDLKSGDKVQLTLSLRESPDVVTTSENFAVTGATNMQQPEFKAGNMLSSSRGRVHLGHLDVFNEDFSVALWIKPKSVAQAAIIGNRKLETREQQGWLLHLQNGALKFTYTPMHDFLQPSYEGRQTYERTETASGGIKENEWTHVAVTVEKSGAIRMYVNGVLRRTAARAFSTVGLNSVQPLSLMADGYEYNELDGFADELKIWRKAISLEDIRETMYAKQKPGDADLVYYNDFNAETTEEQKENFTQSPLRSRTRAVVSFPKMTMAVSASYNSYDTITDAQKEFKQGSVPVAYLQTNNTLNAPVSFSRFDDVYHASDIRGMSENHYEFAPYVYKLDYFNTVRATDSVSLKLYMPQHKDFEGEDIYIGSADADKADWSSYKEHISYEGDYVVLNMKASEINGKLLAFVKVKPAIALRSPVATEEGEINVYNDEAVDSYPLEATLIKSLPQPTAPYGLSSSHSFVVPGQLTFANNVGTGSFTVLPDSMGTFNSDTDVEITGEDGRMIPFKFKVRNKIAPKSQGTALKFNKGGATIGAAAHYAALNNSNQLTMMGWMRVDDNDFFSQDGGVKPVIFFRGGGSTTGIHFDKGEMRCHWNEEGWSWGQSTNLNLTTEDRGKWVHIALVVRPNSISYFLNGKKHQVNRTMSKTRILSALMLGRNHPGDTWFSGAFDQVALWSRSLTDAEVMKYMYNRVLLNDAGLVSYLNMDLTDENGDLVDLVSNATVEAGGGVTRNERASFPFQLKNQTSHSGSAISSTTDAVAVKMPASVKGVYYLSNFGYLPYNYTVAAVSPMYNGHFVVNYASQQNFGANDQVELTLRLPQIKQGQVINLATRPLGSEARFKRHPNATATEDGVVTVSVAATELNEAFEAMWFTPAANLPVVEGIADGMKEDNRVILKDNAVGLPVTFTVTSANKGGDIDLIVDSEFASFDNPVINFSESDQVTRHLIIDRSKMNQTDFNAFKVSFVGAGGKTFVLNVGLEATVELSLVDVTGTSQVTSKSPTTSFDVQVNVLRGVILDPVELKIETDLNYAVSTETDYLTVSGGEKRLTDLEYGNNEGGRLMNGWNTTANPFLANFMLSKQENVELGDVSSLFYRYDHISQNFLAYDIRYIDSEVNLRPLEPVIMHAKNNMASLAFKAQGRNTDYNRRNTKFFQLSEEKEVEIELWHNGIMLDRISVRIDDIGSELFKFGLDAPKLMNTDSRNPMLYTVAADGSKYSIKSFSQMTREVPIGLKAPTAGEYTFKVTRKFNTPDWKATLVDDDILKVINDIGVIHTVNIPEGFGSSETRFSLRLEMPTSTDEIEDNKPHIWASGNTCHINNLSPESYIEIYNLNGQLVINETARSAEWNTKLKEGIYVVRITDLDDRVLSGKIIIK